MKGSSNCLKCGMFPFTKKKYRSILWHSRHFSQTVRLSILEQPLNNELDDKDQLHHYNECLLCDLSQAEMGLQGCQSLWDWIIAQIKGK